MQIEWVYHEDIPQQIKSFVKKLGVSKALLAKIKFQGGQILVNEKPENVLYKLKKNDILRLKFPKEKPAETILLDKTPLDIVYEDEHFLVINKPISTPTIPSFLHPNKTMANRVKNYFVQQNYENMSIHVVTRLDKDTTGLMLFAKSSFAHSLLDQQLRNGKVFKQYCALVSGQINNLQENGEIIAPIARDPNSIIKRQVDPNGKYARTIYHKRKSNDNIAALDVSLKTGRTHQIRVHFAYLNCPLLGDDLYAGNVKLGITRQALHCQKLAFFHPFLKQVVTFKQNLPEDMQKIMNSFTN